MHTFIQNGVNTKTTATIHNSFSLEYKNADDGVYNWYFDTEEMCEMRLGRSQLWCNIHWTACEHGKMNNNNGRSHDDDVDLYILKFPS